MTSPLFPFSFWTIVFLTSWQMYFMPLLAQTPDVSIDNGTVRVGVSLPTSPSHGTKAPDWLRMMNWPGAVITTSKSLAAELGPDNIRVNCINPVFNPTTGLATEFAGGELTEERMAKFRATIPLGRFSTSLDVANAALYLASDEASFISGVCIEVDGARCV